MLIHRHPLESPERDRRTPGSQRAAWLAALLLLLLAVYLVVSSLAALVTRSEPENSWLGLLVAGLAVVIILTARRPQSRPQGPQP